MRPVFSKNASRRIQRIPSPKNRKSTSLILNSSPPFYHTLSFHSEKTMQTIIASMFSLKTSMTPIGKFLSKDLRRLVLRRAERLGVILCGTDVGPSVPKGRPLFRFAASSLLVMINVGSLLFFCRFQRNSCDHFAAKFVFFFGLIKHFVCSSHALFVARFSVDLAYIPLKFSFLLTLPISKKNIENSIYFVVNGPSHNCAS